MKCKNPKNFLKTIQSPMKQLTNLVLFSLLTLSFDMTAQSYTYLGTYNSAGKPNYLMTPGDVVSTAFASRVTKSLPESYKVPSYHPEYLSSTVTNDLVLKDSSDVWITFVDEGAGYKNALAFYTYKTDAPLTTKPASVKIIFPNLSYEDKAVTRGDKIHLGRFPGNTSIGFALVADGFSTSTSKIGTGLNIFYSNPAFNPEKVDSLKKHSALLRDSTGVLVLGFEDIKRSDSGCDQDFNDAIFYLTCSPGAAFIGTFPVTVGSGTGFVTSGGTGGLESDGCLANAIAQRNFTRVKTPSVNYDNFNDLRQFTEPNTGGLMTREDIELEQFIPAAPFNQQAVTAYMTSPKDLIGITNAQKVLSVDYFDDATQGRMAAVLTTKTENKVYDHTKVICDRLTGSTLLYAEQITINNMPFIRSVLQREDGTLEYSICFAVSKDNATTATILSRWAVDEYPSNPQYFNYQVWAEAPHLSQKVVEEILTKLQAQYPNLKSGETAAVPQVFVKKGAYDNGILTLTIKNSLNAKSLTINGNFTQTETKDRADFTKQITLSGAEDETIEVPVGNVFDMGFTVRNDKSADFDALYFADGAWGLEYNKATAKVEKFDINNTTATVEKGVFTVERNPILKGIVKDYVSLFRSLRPAGEATDLTKFKTVSFTGAGQGVVEVTLVKKSITDWTKQYHTSFSLYGEKTAYNIPFDDFTNGSTASEPINANDITHIVFTVKSDGKKDKVLEIGLENLVFSNKKAANIGTQGALTAFPNPAFGRTEIAFNLPENGAGVLAIANTQGQMIFERNQDFSKGSNRMPLDLTNLNSGFYIVSLTTAKGKMATKLFINR
jgi:hypothetical protein